MACSAQGFSESLCHGRGLQPLHRPRAMSDRRNWCLHTSTQATFQIQHNLAGQSRFVLLIVGVSARHLSALFFFGQPRRAGRVSSPSGTLRLVQQSLGAHRFCFAHRRRRRAHWSIPRITSCYRGKRRRACAGSAHRRECLWSLKIESVDESQCGYCPAADTSVGLIAALHSNKGFVDLSSLVFGPSLPFSVSASALSLLARVLSAEALEAGKWSPQQRYRF